jgi:hypothetical protein
MAVGRKDAIRLPQIPSRTPLLACVLSLLPSLFPKESPAPVFCSLLRLPLARATPLMTVSARKKDTTQEEQKRTSFALSSEREKA